MLLPPSFPCGGSPAAVPYFPVSLADASVEVLVAPEALLKTVKVAVAQEAPVTREHVPRAQADQVEFHAWKQQVEAHLLFRCHPDVARSCHKPARHLQT
jgi:hypothetical protein